MPPTDRYLAGFTTLEGGMSGGISPSLIPVNQFSQGANVTIRNGFVSTRPPWFSHPLSPQGNAITTWAGLFQGHAPYNDGQGKVGWVVSRGGYLFFVSRSDYTVTDITPIITITVTEAFTVPALNGTVTVEVTSETPFAIGDVLTIDSGSYTVEGVSVNQLLLRYTGGAAGDTHLQTATVHAGGGGIGYALDEILTPVGGTGSGATMKITGVLAGVITTLSVVTGGTYTVNPASPNAATGGGGAGANLDLAFFAGVAQGSSILRNGESIQQVEPNPPDLDFVYIFQAENYAVVLAGQNQTVIWDGGSSRRTGVDEIPPGYIGAYGWGRIWIARPNRFQFLAGDLVGGSSGTPQKAGRDAILKFTENTYLTGGGSFSVPTNGGLITSMQFLATQDTSLGMGVLLVGTTNMVFSVNAPVDRTTWQTLQYPIQTVSLIDYGPQSPNATVPVNGDMWYRSLDGFRSFIVARRNFPSPGNTPLSHEISPIIENDQGNLISYGSGMLFDNRLLMTVSPFRDTNGVQHRGLVAINYDALSSLQGKSAPAWEGVWTGLNLLQVSKLLYNGEEQGFAFVQGSTDVQLWELSADTSKISDAFVTLPGDTITETPISSWIETRAEAFGHADEQKKLATAALYLDDIAGTVNFTIKYRPDQYPDWITWKTLTLCAANVEQCTVRPAGVPNCSVWKPYARLYAARIMLPRPEDIFCPGGMLVGLPAREAHEIQFRMEWTGHLRIHRFEAHAKTANQPMDGVCPDNLECVSFQSCGTDYFTYAVPN